MTSHIHLHSGRLACLHTAHMSKRTTRGASKQQELLAAQKAAEELEVAELQLSSSDEEEEEEYDSEASLSASGSDGEEGEEGAEVDEEIENAVLGYMAAAEKQRQQQGDSGRCGKESMAYGGPGPKSPGGSAWGGGSSASRMLSAGAACRSFCAPPPLLLCSDDEEASGDSDAEAGGSQDGAAGADSPQQSDDDDEEEEADDAAAAAAAAAAAHEDPGSDSSDEERPQRNTIGEVPLEWYRDEEHVGYDVAGNKLEKKARRDRLDQLIARNDSLGKVGGCLGMATLLWASCFFGHTE